MPHAIVAITVAAMAATNLIMKSGFRQDELAFSGKSGHLAQAPGNVEVGRCGLCGQHGAPKPTGRMHINGRLDANGCIVQTASDATLSFSFTDTNASIAMDDDSRLHRPDGTPMRAARIGNVTVEGDAHVLNVSSVLSVDAVRNAALVGPDPQTGTLDAPSIVTNGSFVCRGRIVALSDIRKKIVLQRITGRPNLPTPVWFSFKGHSESMAGFIAQEFNRAVSAHKTTPPTTPSRHTVDAMEAIALVALAIQEDSFR